METKKKNPSPKKSDDPKKSKPKTKEPEQVTEELKEAPQGFPVSRFWEARTTVGRNKLFSTPSVLEEACLEYFHWNADNPLHEMKPFAYQGEVVQAPVPKIRAMTLSGLCTFLGISRQVWYDYKEHDGGVFLDIIGMVEQVMYEQKFTGAAADMLNANIIARDLGLTDKKDITSAGKQIQNEYHIHPVTTDKNGED